MSATKPVLYTPKGITSLDGKPFERIELGNSQMQLFRQFGEIAQHYQLGIHCQLCDSDLTAGNHERALIFATACKCREFVGANLLRLELESTRKWFRQFARLAASYRLALHCGKCGSDLIVRLNDETEQGFLAACTCREFSWKAPDHGSETAAPVRVQ